MDLPQPDGIVRQILKAWPVLLASFTCAPEPIPSCQCPLTLSESPFREYRSVVFSNNVTRLQTAYRFYYDMPADKVSANRRTKEDFSNFLFFMYQ